jgi:hypothetical protein
MIAAIIVTRLYAYYCCRDLREAHCVAVRILTRTTLKTACRRLRYQRGRRISSGVTSIHIQSGQKTIFAADRASRILQFYRAVITDWAIASHEWSDSWNKRGQPVGMEMVRAVEARSKMYGQQVRTFLCVRIGTDDDGARLSDGMWNIRGKYTEKPSHMQYTEDNLHRVHY